VPAADLIDVKVQDVYEVPEVERNEQLWQLGPKPGGRPAWAHYVAFINSRPYRDWYFIQVEGELAGCVHVTLANEIVMSMLADYYDAGIGSVVIREMFARYPGETLYARVSGADAGADAFIRGCGFHEITRLYEIKTPYVEYASSWKGKK